MENGVEKQFNSYSRLQAGVAICNSRFPHINKALYTSGVGNGSHTQLPGLCYKAFLNTNNIRPCILIIHITISVKVQMEPADDCSSSFCLSPSFFFLASVCYLHFTQGAERGYDKGKLK